jgi:CubicO group peptidase (beta-lactamase class C family)
MQGHDTEERAKNEYKGYGYADIEKKLPVDPDRTVFRVASISKVITATGC